MVHTPKHKEEERKKKAPFGSQIPGLRKKQQEEREDKKKVEAKHLGWSGRYAHGGGLATPVVGQCPPCPEVPAPGGRPC